MSKSPSNFRQADVKRGLKAFKTAGARVKRIVIEGSKIEYILDEDATDKPGAENGNRSLMPRPRPPHLCNGRLPSTGKTVWYVRVGRGPRVRIRAEFGTPEFDAEYQRALSGNPRPSKAGAAVGTLAWLIERYRETTAWTDLSLATRRTMSEHLFPHLAIR